MNTIKPGDEGYGAALAALLARGARGIGKRFKVKEKRRWTLPHQGAKERARRVRQIKAGVISCDEVQP